ncbi:MAG: glutamate--cysteine ligase [Nitrococcus mobilis]|nr:glutamate--cysteine ligase [Nitrococcus mobilis]
MVAMPAKAAAQLTMALTGPLHRIESLRLVNQSIIESWPLRHGQRTPAPFHASFNLRHVGFKLALADTKLSPMGFNNLNPGFQPPCVHAIQPAMERVCASAHCILIVPESHTRNLFYLESLATLYDLLVNTGHAILIGSLRPAINAATFFDLPSGRRLTLEPPARSDTHPAMAGFAPCLAPPNSAPSGGHPASLQSLERPVILPLALGWTKRRKSDHFDHYRRVAKEFCELIHNDPWLITPLHRACGAINFKRCAGKECLTSNVHALLAEIPLKYTAKALDRQPHQPGSLPHPRCRTQSLVCLRRGCPVGAAGGRPRTYRGRHYREDRTR